MYQVKGVAGRPNRPVTETVKEKRKRGNLMGLIQACSVRANELIPSRFYSACLSCPFLLHGEKERRPSDPS